MAADLTASEKVRIAEEIFRKMILQRAEETATYESLRLEFTNDVVIRTPHLWLLVFSARGCVRRSFVKDDRVKGSQVEAFEQNVAR